MADRKAISKKIRFEIFKRDSFTCQYCGKSAPDVILELDHIQPISKNGEDDVFNLITSCFDCNRGKSNNELSDDTVIQKRKAQLDQLQERREQLDMMLEWQKGLSEITSEEVDKISEFWDGLTPGWSLNENGKENVRKLIKKFGIPEVLESMKIAANYYIKISGGEAIENSASIAFDKIGGICANRKTDKTNPEEAMFYYIRGIVRKRLYCNDMQAIILIRKAYKNGHSIEQMKHLASVAPTRSSWRDEMEYLAGEK
jgi:hypothetical protein